MPTGKYEKDHPFAELIPLEGAFLSVFLPAMPPLFVKIYLYLLNLCHHPELAQKNLSKSASELGCTEKDLTDGLSYLSEKQLISFTARPFTFELRSVAAAARREGAYAASLNAYAEYFAGIRALFPGREIANYEYEKARDWVELYGLSVETALLMISHCIERKDARISFAYMDKEALTWANEGILTSEAAEAYLTEYAAKTHEAAKLLQHLGLKRTPTVDEMKLYQDWLSLGFDLRGIKAACSETTKTATPNFAYIDRILRHLHSLDLHGEKEIKAYLTESNEERRLTAVILTELGERNRTVSSAHVEQLKAISTFHTDALLLVARKLSENGSHTFTKYIQTLKELKDSGSITKEQIETYFASAAAKKETRSGKTPSDAFAGRNEQYGDTLYTDTDHLEV